MKIFFAFIVAIFASFAATYACAVETDFIISSKIGDQEVVLAEDVAVKVLDVDGNVVAESVDNATPTFDLAPGVYVVVAEQSSTGFFGQKEIEVYEGQTSDPIELILTDDELDASLENSDAFFTTQDDVCQSDVCDVCAPICQPCFPPLPACEPTGDFVNIPGCWSLLGSVGGLLIVVVPDKDDVYATYDNRYR